MSGAGRPEFALDAHGLRVVVVAGSWHTVISDGLLAGAERALYLFAHNRPWSYGLVSVAIALAAGWAASVVFRRN